MLYFMGLAKLSQQDFTSSNIRLPGVDETNPVEALLNGYLRTQWRQKNRLLCIFFFLSGFLWEAQLCILMCVWLAL